MKKERENFREVKEEMEKTSCVRVMWEEVVSPHTSHSIVNFVLWWRGTRYSSVYTACRDEKIFFFEEDNDNILLCEL